MPNPTPSDRHISAPLTAMSIAYPQDSSEFVARRVFPVVPSMKQYDKYYEFNQADFNRIQMTQRAPATESAEGRYRLSNSAFHCDVFALHKDISDRERANADSVFALDAEAVEFLTGQSLLKEEYDFASKYLVNGVWGSTITGVAAAPGANQVLQWNDGASTPIENIRTGCRTIKGRTGYRANKLVLGQEAWDQLVDHPDIIDRIKGAASPSSPAIVQRQAVAALFELDEVLVMGAIVNTAAEGQSGSHSWVAGKNALLVHAAPRPARMTPSAGYTFAWTNYTPYPGSTDATAVAISRFRMEHLKSDRVEIESAYVQQVTGAPLGYLFLNIVA